MRTKILLEMVLIRNKTCFVSKKVGLCQNIENPVWKCDWYDLMSLESILQGKEDTFSMLWWKGKIGLSWQLLRMDFSCHIMSVIRPECDRYSGHNSTSEQEGDRMFPNCASSVAKGCCLKMNWSSTFPCRYMYRVHPLLPKTEF